MNRVEAEAIYDGSFWIALAVKPGSAELIEPKNRVLTGANGRECRLLLGLVEKAPVFSVFSTRLVIAITLPGSA